MRLAGTFLSVPRRVARDYIAEEPGYGEIYLLRCPGLPQVTQRPGLSESMMYLLLPSVVQEVEWPGGTYLRQPCTV